MSQALFSFKALTLAGSDVPRLKSVTLQISCGATAVVGLSGAGKTSLLNVLAGFETDFSGELTSHMPVEGGNRLPLFWVPQSGGLWPHLTAKQHLDVVGSEATRNQESDQKSKQVSKNADEFLTLFDLHFRQRALPAELSQGERSRLALARALAARANILLLDEPLSHVDPVRKPNYWRIVRQIIAEENTSMVFTSHEPETVLRHAEHVICLHDGSVVFDGAVRTLYDDPPNAQIGAFLGPLNWFRADEAAAFIVGQDNSTADLGIRPERLRIHLQEDSPIEVMSQPFSGMYTESIVKHQTTQTIKTILHQSSDVPQRIGDRVAFRIVPFALLLGLFIIGCGQPTTDPELSFSKFDTWKVPASGSFLPAPRGLYADENDTVYVLDDAGRVLVYEKSGKLVKQWEMPEFAAGKPEGVWKLVDGRVAVADTHYHRVVIFNDDGTVSHKFGTQGNGQGQFVFPVTIAQDPKGFIYVGEYGDRQRIQKFTVDGEFVTEFGQHGSKDGEFQRPSGVAWQDGLVYVVDAFNDRIQVFEDGGKFVRIIKLPDKSDSLEYPYDIRLDKKNQIYVIENKAARLTVLRLDGTIVGRYGRPGRGLDQFYQPWDLTVMSDGRILIADTGNHRLVELTP